MGELGGPAELGLHPRGLMEKAPFGSFHQYEIGCRRDGKKSKVSPLAAM
jgi:hypothetical protein